MRETETSLLSLCLRADAQPSASAAGTADRFARPDHAATDDGLCEKSWKVGAWLAELRVTADGSSHQERKGEVDGGSDDDEATDVGPGSTSEWMAANTRSLHLKERIGRGAGPS